MKVSEDVWAQARQAFAVESEEDEMALRRAIEALPGHAPVPGAAIRTLVDQVALTALRKSFGDRASVSVPQGDYRASARLDQLLADNAGLGRERDQLRAELDECRGRLGLMTQDYTGADADRVALRREIEKTRAELEQPTQGVRSLRDLTAELDLLWKFVEEIAQDGRGVYTDIRDVQNAAVDVVRAKKDLTEPSR